MTPDNPPVRLAADPNTPEALRSLVEHARNDLPDASMIAQFGSRMETAIAANVPAPTVNLSLPSTSSVVGIKPLGVALAVVLAGVVAGGVWFGARGNGPAALTHADSQTPVVTALAPADSQTPAVTALAPADSQTPAVTALAPADSQTPAASDEGRLAPTAGGAPSASPAAVAKQSPSHRVPNDEATLLLSARAALGSDPATALRLTKEHARRYANGSLIQEREVIAIEALRRLGQTDAAQQRGAAFEKQFPGSAHRSKVEQTLQGK